VNIPFYKCEANGNDFIFVFSNDFLEVKNKVVLIAKMCRRQTGIGADGLFIISDSDFYDFKLDYYNADGSWETFCANGSRCAAKVMQQLSDSQTEASFETGAGSHITRIHDDGTVSMQMTRPEYRSELLTPEDIPGFHIDSGAPHFVCESQNLTNEFVVEKGRRIRFHSFFQPRGINVNFYSLLSDNELEVRTYEKGVESLMQSCSSGSTAVVYHLSKNKKVSSPVTTRSPGGDLHFEFDDDWQNAWCKGAARIVYEGVYTAGKRET
jgi:diaminopimelate epimerase